MAKITLDSIASGYQSTAQVNNNNAEIADHLNNRVLYRNNPAGEPNQMYTNLDMNGYAIINADIASIDQVIIADNVIYDPVGNTYLTSNNAQDSLDQADAEFISIDARLDSAESDIAMAQVDIDDLAYKVFVNTGDIAAIENPLTPMDFFVTRKATAALSSIYTSPSNRDLNTSGGLIPSAKFMLERTPTNLVDCVLGSTVINLTTPL